MFHEPMFYIRIYWKHLGKHVLAWVLLFPWFLWNRSKTEKTESSMFKYGYECKCGVSTIYEGYNGWRGWFETIESECSLGGEYGGTEWYYHKTCWKCGSYHYGSDSSC